MVEARSVVRIHIKLVLLVDIGSNPIFSTIKLNFNLKFKTMLDINLLIHILESWGKQQTLTPSILIEILKEYQRKQCGS